MSAGGGVSGRGAAGVTGVPVREDAVGCGCTLGLTGSGPGLDVAVPVRGASGLVADGCCGAAGLIVGCKGLAAA